MDEQKKNALQTLITSLDEIVACDAERLAEGENLGTINFQDGKNIFDLTIKLAQEARPLPWDILPSQPIQQVQGPTQSTAAALKQVSEFTLEAHENPKAQRDSLLTSAQQHYDAFLTAMMPFLPYLTLKSAQVHDIINKAATLVEETQTKVTQLLEDVEKKKTEIDSVVRAARDAAAKIGVAQFATKFEDNATEHEQASTKWLRATVLIGTGTVLVAGLFTWLALYGTKDFTVQQSITKLVVVSLLYIAAIWSSKNYRAHRHLAVVNRHRQNALATFQTFVKAAGDEDQQTKNAVLLEATRCIFSSSVTGYISSDTDTSSNRVIEILKTIGSET
jgi:hypothetical protein